MNDFLLTIAPTIASALLGPLGGVAVAGLGKILGIDGATTKDITKAITESKITPDQIAAIKTLELQLQNEELERGFKYKELEFKDTDSARAMQIATHSWVPAALAMLVTGGFFGILIFMVTNGSYKPTEPLLVMLGSLGTAWTMIIGFYFGSSHGSQNKDVLLAQAVPPTK
jgi:hypothetical protein